MTGSNQSRDNRRPNVFVLTADSLRADVAREMAAELSRLVDGVRFTDAVATANATAHSIPSMAFGVYRDAVGPTLETDEITTLAEALRREGYHTALWTDNRVFGPERNFDRGFTDAGGEDTWRQTAQRLVERTGSQRLFDAARAGYFHVVRPVAGLVGEDHHYPPAEALHERALEEIREAGPAPQFHWVHYMDTHHPFEPPQSYLGERSFHGSGDRRALGDLSSRAMISNLGEGLTRADLGDVREAYLASCEYWFDETRRFVETLLEEDHFVPGRDVLVISSDHGESFDVEAHDMLGHTPTPAFWEELIRVPLVVSHPEWTPRTVNDQVSLIDLVPTILRAVDAPVPGSAAGRAADAPGDLAREFAYLTAQGPEHFYHGVRWDEGYKLFPDRIRAADGNEIMADDESPDDRRILLTRFGGDGGEEVVFSHDLDELEARPADDGTAATYERLLGRLVEERDGLVADEERRLDDAIEEQLQHLGYVDDV